VAFEWFEQGVAAVGGGSVLVRADGNIRDLSAAIPTIGRQTGSATNASLSQVVETGGGHLSIRALGDITGGTAFIGRGAAEVMAGGSVGVSAATAFAPVLAAGDSTIQVSARRNLEVETILNPTLLPISRRLGVVPSSYFSNYTSTSAVDLVAAGGNLRVGTDTNLGSQLSQRYGSVLYVDTPVARFLPPT
jgi:hypothetical protein